MDWKHNKKGILAIVRNIIYNNILDCNDYTAVIIIVLELTTTY